MKSLNDSLPSATALLSAAARAAHPLVDQPPHALVDSAAAALCAVFEPSPLSYQLAVAHEPILASARISTVARSAYARQVIAEAAPRQLVMLGAGLDTSVSDGCPAAVWAVDQPAVLDWRAELFAEAGVDEAACLVAADLRAGGLMAALTAAGLDAELPTAVVGLGLSMYLTGGDNQAIWQELSSLAPGSLLVFDVIVPDELADEAGRHYAAAVSAAAGGAEPWRWRPSPDQVAEALANAGWLLESTVAEADVMPQGFWRANPSLPRQRLVQLVRARTAAGTTL